MKKSFVVNGVIEENFGDNEHTLNIISLEKYFELSHFVLTSLGKVKSKKQTEV